VLTKNGLFFAHFFLPWTGEFSQLLALLGLGGDTFDDQIKQTHLQPVTDTGAPPASNTSSLFQRPVGKDEDVKTSNAVQGVVPLNRYAVMLLSLIVVASYYL
jgi:hypothetical protein